MRLSIEASAEVAVHIGVLMEFAHRLKGFRKLDVLVVPAAANRQNIEGHHGLGARWRESPCIDE